MLSSSILTDLPGIGKKTRTELLKSFGSIEEIRSASFQELIDSGLNKKQAAVLRDFFSHTNEEE